MGAATPVDIDVDVIDADDAKEKAKSVQTNNSGHFGDVSS